MQRVQTSSAHFPEGMTFESVYVGGFNNDAFRLVDLMAGGVIYYHWLLVVGAMGVGKTHLCKALAKRWLSLDRTVGYWDANDFELDCRDDGEGPEEAGLRDHYKNYDLLIVDDIQFLPKSAQAALAQLLNARTEKSTVLVSHKLPRDLPDFDPYLFSRLQSCLAVIIAEPSAAELEGVLLQKSQQMGLRLDDKSRALIAKRCKNIREVEGILALVRSLALSGQPPTFDLVRDVLAKCAGVQLPTTPRNIMAAVGEKFGYEVKDLVGLSRKRHLVYARQIAMYLIRQLCALSYPAIGDLFGNRDHTTVMHGVAKIRELKLLQQDCSDDINDLMAQLQVRPALSIVKIA